MTRGGCYLPSENIGKQFLKDKRRIRHCLAETPPGKYLVTGSQVIPSQIPRATLWSTKKSSLLALAQRYFLKKNTISTEKWRSKNVLKSLCFHPILVEAPLFVSSDRSSYSDSGLLYNVRSSGHFLRFRAFLPIYLVFLFENWMQIDNNWPWGPWWL